MVAEDIQINAHVFHHETRPFEDFIVYYGWLVCNSRLTCPHMPECVIRQFDYMELVPRDLHNLLSDYDTPTMIRPSDGSVVHDYLRWYFKVSHTYMIGQTDIDTRLFPSGSTVRDVIDAMMYEALQYKMQLDKRRRRRNDLEMSEDKLSDLSDSILIHILSFLNTKDSVQTCILSKRWNHVWKYIPMLTLNHSHFSTRKSFDKLVSRFLSLRDNSIVLHAIDFIRNGSIDSRLLRRLARYVLSHNVKLLRLRIDVKCDIAHILPCISSCHTLTSLKLSVSPNGRHNYGRTMFPKSLNLPALTCLHLGNFAFSASEDGRIDPFSAFNKLNDLTIDNCSVRNSEILCISSETLVSLTMRNHSFNSYQIKLSAPSLCSFAFTGTPYQMFRGSSLSSIKDVNIDAEMLANYGAPPFILRSWLLKLANVKSLTVSASTLQVLSLIPNYLLKLKISSLHSLKSLKVKLKPLSYGLSMALKIVKLENALKAGFEPSSPIPDGILNFLLQNSPSAAVDIIDCSRCDDSFDHLPPFSSSLFAQFLQPSSQENAMYDLYQRLQYLEQVLQQTQRYLHLAEIKDKEEILALKEHVMMMSKTMDAIAAEG
ncbi:F-box protein At4g22280-like [Vicia villosa]|uniref:F-box protein At4g22280-like n=1 Tax=Vicia villosa TaxID=3911 RepID=UPI00273B386A|nr:F-box protein At4g22280-like [Vicia villosa]